MRRVTTAVVAGAVGLVLAGCTATDAADRSASTATGAGSTTPGVAAAGASTAATGTGVWGLAYGEIPAIPLIQVPDLSVLDAAQQAFAAAVSTRLAAVAAIPGVSVGQAHCDSSGTLVRDDGALYGDGSGSFVDSTGGVVDYGDGSGVAASARAQYVNYGDGSGTYSKDGVQIVNYGDGSGNYADGSVHVVTYGDGSGKRSDGSATIVDYGDGSGNYTDRTTTIVNYGDGSGVYLDGATSIVNHGDGTGTVDGTPVTMTPLAPVAAVGKFPPLQALTATPPVCGMVVTLPDSVLFDFGSDQLSAAAAGVLAGVAAEVARAGLTGTVKVYGHTDSVGTDEFNQALSERRATAVADSLKTAGLANPLDVQGFGETQPVAPNEIDGQDNPAGRALNRRVEIVLPVG